MNDLRREFEQAAEDIQRLATRPDNDTLLKLYALYKQGSEGDLQRRPARLLRLRRHGQARGVGAAARHARDEAMRRYIALVRATAAPERRCDCTGSGRSLAFHP